MIMSAFWKKRWNRSNTVLLLASLSRFRAYEAYRRNPGTKSIVISKYLRESGRHSRSIMWGSGPWGKSNQMAVRSSGHPALDPPCQTVEDFEIIRTHALIIIIMISIRHTLLRLSSICECSYFTGHADHACSLPPPLRVPRNQSYRKFLSLGRA